MYFEYETQTYMTPTGNLKISYEFHSIMIDMHACVRSTLQFLVPSKYETIEFRKQQFSFCTRSQPAGIYACSYNHTQPSSQLKFSQFYSNIYQTNKLKCTDVYVCSEPQRTQVV